jgi:DNA-binding beta-propeller fold protein YncE
MKRYLRVSGTVCALFVAAGFATFAVQHTAAQGRGAAPAYRVDPLWPQPLPNHWVLGSVTGVATDAQDHVWVVHRGADSLEAAEKGMTTNPPTSSICCTPAPFVLEFDQTGKVVSSFGGPGQGYQWPQSPGGIAVDAKGNVWITAAGLDPAPPPAPGARGRGDAGADAGGRGGRGAAAPAVADAHVLKFSKSGQFLLQIGTPGKMESGDSQTTLNRPHGIAVDAAANEVYVADTGNRRIVVFDADKGTYKRSWGANGEKPGADPGAYDPNAAPARQFRDPTCVEIAKDGMVYVCDRSSDRIQVFQKDGKFVKEAAVSKTATGTTVTGQFGALDVRGSVWDVAFSNDAQQRYVFVADGVDKQVIVLQRDTLAQVGTVGQGGRQAGRFLVVSTVAVDSRGNLYTGEQHHGKRVQKFVPGR